MLLDEQYPDYVLYLAVPLDTFTSPIAASPQENAGKLKLISLNCLLRGSRAIAVSSEPAILSLDLYLQLESGSKRSRF